MAETNEPPHQAAQREIKEELGLGLRVGELLCVDWVAPHGPWDGLLAFIFNGGEVTDEQVTGPTLLDGELAAFEFCTEEQARQKLRPYLWRRAAKYTRITGRTTVVIPELPFLRGKMASRA